MEFYARGKNVEKNTMSTADCEPECLLLLSRRILFVAF